MPAAAIGEAAPSEAKAIKSSFDLAPARAAQKAWAGESVADRLKVIRRFRRQLAMQGRRLAQSISPRLQRTAADTLSAEVIPLAEAARFVELHAERLLRPETLPADGRPSWLKGVEIVVHREPHGCVLVIAPANYPLFLPGVQTLQALAAGNAVVWKPGAGGRAIADDMAALFREAGLPFGLLTVTDERPEAAQAYISAGVDKVVLTGSASSGRSVLEQCAQKATPATVELSGCDAVFVLPGADIERAARAVAFGLAFNGSATCIAPRRVFLVDSVAAEFEGAFDSALRELPAIAAQPAIEELVRDACQKGGIVAGDRTRATIIMNATPQMRVMQADTFAPVLAVMRVSSVCAAACAANECPYALGASVFGEMESARRFAAQIDAGIVVINDMIAPTADPRLSFGGRKASGFGKTRGAEGLLEMTVTKQVVEQHARRLRHLEAPFPRALDLFDSYLRLRHSGGVKNWFRAAADVCRAVTGKN